MSPGKDLLFWGIIAIVAISAVESSAPAFIHNAIVFIDTWDNAWYNQLHWVVETPYLSTIDSNGCVSREALREWVIHQTRLQSVSIGPTATSNQIGVLKKYHNYWYVIFSPDT